jgi:hypothetical protein
VNINAQQFQATFPFVTGPAQWQLGNILFFSPGANGTGTFLIEFQRGSTLAVDFLVDALQG